MIYTCTGDSELNAYLIGYGTATALNTQDAIAKGRRPALPPNATPRVFCKNGHDMSVTRRPKGPSGGSECGECRRNRHTEYMRSYRKRQKERSS